MTAVVQSAAVTTAAAGTTKASFTVLAVNDTCTLVPGLSCCLGFFASNQISTVVLFGSSAGLTTVTFPSTGSSNPGTVIVPLSPTFSKAASAWGMCAFAITAARSITVTIGVPAAAISPGYNGRSVTTPSIGLRISE